MADPRQGSPRPFQRLPACPFKAAARVEQFNGMVTDYQSHSAALWHGPAGCYENRANNIGEAFWRGFHGETFIWDKDAPLYVAFRAGGAIANAIAPTAPVGARARLSGSMLAVLRLAEQRQPLYTGCKGRSEYGGRDRTIGALRQMGLIEKERSALTEAGRHALASGSAPCATERPGTRW